MHVPSPPSASEYAPIYAEYLDEVSAPDIVAELARQRDVAEAAFAPLSDAEALARYAPEKWSVKQVLGHLADAERVLAYRMLRISRGDTTPLPGFDENDYAQAARSDERPLASLRAEFAAVRAATVALAESLDREAWMRQGTANGTAVSARALVYIIVGHTAHHLRVLRERYRVG